MELRIEGLLAVLVMVLAGCSTAPMETHLKQLAFDAHYTVVPGDAQTAPSESISANSTSNISIHTTVPPGREIAMNISSVGLSAEETSIRIEVLMDATDVATDRGAYINVSIVLRDALPPGTYGVSAHIVNRTPDISFRPIVVSSNTIETSIVIPANDSSAANRTRENSRG